MYDTIGNIAIIKFPEKTKEKAKKEFAKKILRESKNIKTILEKKEKVKGRLRILKTKFLAGKNTSITTHKESSCFFRLDVKKCYFSPRMGNDRLEIAKRIKKNSSVLVLFSGISPYPIIISKFSNPKKIIAIELGNACNKYAKENIELNKIKNIELIQGDVKKILPKLKEKFDYIIMARPQLKENFLKEVFKITKPKTKIFYHGFGKNIKEIKYEIKNEAEKNKIKIKFLEFWKNGDIAPYKFRFTILFKILN